MRNLTQNITIILIAVTLGLTAPIFAQESEILHSGSWTKKKSAIEGNWEIVREGEKRFVVLDKNFSTKKAPDLKIFLSPLPLESLNDDNLTVRGRLISPLKSHEGAQRFEIPAKIKLESYKSIVIHCEKYEKLWGGASLNNN